MLNVRYTSEWSNYGSIVTYAMLNLDTGVVFNIEQDNDTPNNIGSLEKEYITTLGKDETDYDVFCNENNDYYIASGDLEKIKKLI